MVSHPPVTRVAVLLSTFNGQPFLQAQLDSFIKQSHDHWLLYWRDDGSSDDTRIVMDAFSRGAGQGRCVEIAGSGERLGVGASFHRLLCHAAEQLGPDDLVAFADQDDVWLPHKMDRGITALTGIAPDQPALYCARQQLVDAELRPIGLSVRPAPTGGFPAALIQNVATGCTILLNRRAARLVAQSRPSPATLHDWWCYLVVMGAGGKLLQDPEPVILYRQHGANLVGAPHSTFRRGLAAMRRGPGVFMGVLRQHIAALAEQPELLTAQARREVATLHKALHRRSLWQRLMALRMPGLTRQTWTETLVFRTWFLIG